MTATHPIEIELYEPRPAHADLALLEQPESNPALSYLRSLAPGSRRSMTTAMKTVLSCLGASGDPLAFPWQHLTYVHTSAVRAALAAKYSPATANHALACLRGIMKQAWRLGLLDSESYHRSVDLEPIRGSRLPAGRSLSAGEVRALFIVCAADESTAGRRDSAVLAVLYGGGLRAAELVGLDLDSYDQATGDITVTGKGNKQRLVPMTGGAIPALAAWLEIRGDRPGPLFLAINKGGRILDHGISPQALTMTLSKRADEASVSHFSPHDLRRSFVGDLLDAGADVVSVQKLCGHADPATTSRYDRRPAAVARKAAGLLVIPFQSA